MSTYKYNTKIREPIDAEAVLVEHDDPDENEWAPIDDIGRRLCELELAQRSFKRLSLIIAWRALQRKRSFVPILLPAD